MLRAEMTVLSAPVSHGGASRFSLGIMSFALVVTQHHRVSLSRRCRLPFTFVTKEVAEATCNCLLAQAEQADKKGKSKAAAERMILEEFGRCLMSVINSAGKAKSDPCAMNC